MKRSSTNSVIIFSLQLLILMVLSSCSSAKDQISISADATIPQIAFALDELNTAFKEKGIAAIRKDREDADIVFSIQDSNGLLKEEGFSIYQAIWSYSSYWR